MGKNKEKDFEFFVRRGIAGIILSVLIMLVLELTIVYYYLLIAKEENFYDAFRNHASGMIILPVLPLYFMLLEISKFREGKKLRKDFLDNSDTINSRKKLYYHGNVNGKSDDEFGNMLFIIRKRSFFNYFFLPNLVVPVLLFSAFTFFNEVPVLKTVLAVFSVLLIFNIIRNFFSVMKFYEYGMIIYKLSGKIRVEYKDIINFGSLFQDNKSESRFKIGTDLTKINIDTMKYAVRFSVSTSRSGDKIHKEIMEFIPDIEKVLYNEF